MTKDMKKRAGLELTDEPVVLTPELAERFIDVLVTSGRRPQTVRIYKRALKELYEFLPEGKEITKEVLEEWRGSLKKRGYTDGTISVKLCAANGVLRYCGREEMLAPQTRGVVIAEVMPQLTREEYLRFLCEVREAGKETAYLLIKVLASVDISVTEIECITAKACREGVIHAGEDKTALIPGSLKTELMRYAKRQGITDGPIFVTKNGTLIDRSNINQIIRRLALRTGVEPEKCCPSALHRLYLATQREIKEQMQPSLIEAYESLLNEEQAMMAMQEHG